jgi:hypothetical protein
VSLEAVVSIAVLALGFAVAIGAAVRSDSRLHLRLAHPAVAWLALTGIFFGLGSVVLASGGRPGPAAYVGAATAAFGLGLLGSDALARWRALRATAKSAVEAAAHAPTRIWAVALLAGIGLLAVAPTLIQSGIPFLVNDITAARAELSGLSVQILRVTLAGAAAVAVLLAATSPSPRRRWLALAAIVAIAAFEVLLASRYLLAELAATIVLAWLLGGRRIPLNVAGGVLVVVAVAFGGIQLLRAYDQAKGQEIDFVIDRTVNRIVLVQPRTLDALMEVIPKEHDYFLGLTWFRRLAPLLGRDDVPNLGYWIYPRVVRGDQVTSGYAAPGWLGEAWANFGWAGIALFVALGVAVERLAALVALRTRRGVPPGAADVGAAALAILFVARTHALGVAGLAILLLLVAAWRLLAAPSRGLWHDVARTLAWRS